MGGASICSDDKQKCRQILLEVSNESFEEKVSKALHVFEMPVQKSQRCKVKITSLSHAHDRIFRMTRDLGHV